MDASLRWHDEKGRKDASLRPLLRIRALAALVHSEHRWHDEEMAKGCFFIGVESGMP